MKALQAVTKRLGGPVKVLSALLMAGAALSVAAPAARAQVAFGVEVGRPGYYAPAPVPAPVYAAPAYGYGYDPHAFWEHRRYDDWRAREWREHEYWQQRRAYDWNRRYEGGYGWR